MVVFDFQEDRWPPRCSESVALVCVVFSVFALAEDAVSRSLSLSLETMKPGSQTSTKLRSLGSNVNGDSWQGTEDTQKDAKMVGH